MSTELTIWALYAGITVFEVVVLTVRTGKLLRASLGAILILLLSAVHTLLVMQEPLVFGIPLFTIGVYRILNILRFSIGRMHESYLYKSVSRTSMTLGMYQLLLGALAVLIPSLPAMGYYDMYAFTFMLLVIYIAMSWSFVKTLRLAKIRIANKQQSSETLPTVTIAIPARNETSELQACISSILASAYQKLEIIVLDDCSQDSTSDIIKDFAHDGVRFIQGDEPGDTWLAKNAAYDRLLKEANGEIILFCGADVRFAKNAIGQLVAFMNEQELAMVSVLPKKDSLVKQQSIVQFARYMWELFMPRTLVNRPPILSTLWLANKSSLLKLGGFSSVKRMVVPEAYFAKRLQKTNEYRFVMSDPLTDIQSTKTTKQQINTAVRIRYPQLHKRPENVLAVSLLVIVLFFGPVFTALFGYYNNHLLLLCGLLLIVLQIILYSVLAHKTGQAFIGRILLYVLMTPAVDVLMMHYSMVAYEFGSVTWKERNVCLPVMHVTPSLPKLPDSSRV